ncbi:MAG: hypothetical protein IJ387_05845 [Thermoguttaceae bacterium]|nr:hypothetical protein [Thermoguttaceae bacterium]
MSVVGERGRKRTRVCGVARRFAALLTAVFVANGLFFSAIQTVEGAPPRRTAPRTSGFRDDAAKLGETSGLAKPGALRGTGEPAKPGALRGTGEPAKPGALRGTSEPAKPGALRGTSEPAKLGASAGTGGVRQAERNDGALPAAVGASCFSPEEERDAAALWRDPSEAERLRAQVLDAARRRRETWPPFPAINEKKAAELGIRRIEGKNVTLTTDLPPSPGVDQIPAALDAAIPHICRFFNVDERKFENWKINAFLMGNVDSFIEIGVLDGPPRFLYGYSVYDRILAKDQKIEYYNRFLLLHELVHSFMHEVFGDLRPRWYSEGSAEYLALHLWKPAKKSIEIAQFQTGPDATPGFGRLQEIREIVRAGKAPTLREILAFEPRDYVRTSTYAWSWALVAFLNESPKYRDVADLLPYWSTYWEPNRVFADIVGDRWGELENDWADFVGRIDFGYDFDATAVDAAPGRPFEEAAAESGNAAVVVEAAANRGWQNSGVALEAGTTYRLATAGRFALNVEEAGKKLEFEAPGATFRYVEGAPLGRLQAVVVPLEGATFDEFYSLNSAGWANGAPSNGAAKTVGGLRRGKSANEAKSAPRGTLEPWDAAVGFETSTTTLTPERAGTLFFRINDAPANLAKNAGSVKIQIKRAAPNGRREESAKSVESVE